MISPGGPQPELCNCLALRQAARRMVMDRTTLGRNIKPLERVTQFYDGYLAAAGLRATQFSVLVRLRRLAGEARSRLHAQTVQD